MFERPDRTQSKFIIKLVREFRITFRAWLKLSDHGIHDLKTYLAFRSHHVNIFIQANVSFVRTEGRYLIFLAKRPCGHFQKSEN